MVLSHEIEGSNPFGATNNEAENSLCRVFRFFIGVLKPPVVRVIPRSDCPVVHTSTSIMTTDLGIEVRPLKAHFAPQAPFLSET